MKKTITLLLAIVFLPSFLKAQCSTILYPAPGMIQVTNNQTINSSGMPYWICSGLTVTVASSAGSLFVLEENVTLIINGSAGDEVFAKTGCTVINNTGQDIGVTCNTSNVTLTNNSTGNIVVTANCTALTYDYSLVGGSACTGTSTTVEEETEKRTVLYPNPASDILYFSEPCSRVVITDLAGRVVLEHHQAGTSVSLSELTPGAYFVTLFNGSGKQCRRIVKN